MKKIFALLFVATAVTWSLPAQAAYINTFDKSLYEYDINQHKATYLGKTTRQFTDIAVSSGKLYGISMKRFYSIDPKTGQATHISDLDGYGYNALVGDPKSKSLYTLTTGGQFGRITESGKYTLIGTLGEYGRGPLHSSGDMVYGNDGTLYAAVAPWWNSWFSTNSMLAKIDPRTGHATIIGSLGFRSVLGLMNIDGTIYGTTFDKKLIKINTNTGKATLVTRMNDIREGPVWGATGGTAMATTPEPGTLLLLSSAVGMILWRRRRAAV